MSNNKWQDPINFYDRVLVLSSCDVRGSNKYSGSILDSLLWYGGALILKSGTLNPLSIHPKCWFQEGLVKACITVNDCCVQLLQFPYFLKQHKNCHASSNQFIQMLITIHSPLAVPFDSSQHLQATWQKEIQSTLGFATMGKAANLCLATRNAVTVFIYFWI